MTHLQKPRLLVILHLVGGNDALDTLVPYGDPLYYDNRPVARVPEEQVLHIDDRVGLHPSMAALKPFYDQGKMAIILGIGYPNRNYSHFRSTDIWETAEPKEIIASGWLARAVREIDPSADNVLTAVNFGRGLPRALSLNGVPVASVAKIESYGLFPNLVDTSQRETALATFAHMYATSPESHHLPPDWIHSSRRVSEELYCREAKGDRADQARRPGYPHLLPSHGSFDLHAIQLPNHADRWREVSEAVAAFFADLRAHHAAGDIILFMWSEFGRRVRDNGGGTDHGAGGLTFPIGD